MQKYKKIISVIIFLLIIPIVLAQREGSIPLLALVESNGASRGGVANLHLSIQEGNGGVFLDTFPLTKFTTQISMRFAQQMACQELDLDCSNLNFFYTIRSAKGIIGGPSAGAAATILTASLLKDLHLNESVVMTGTINSGGMIGSVGGLKEKIEAAAQQNFSKVLIPRGTREQEENNATIDIVEYGKKQGIEVIEVGTLSEALEHFDKNFIGGKISEFYTTNDYKTIIKEISNELCSRVKRFDSQLENATKKALEEEAYYSAASLCFRSRVQEKSKEYLNLSINKEHLPFLKMILEKKIENTRKRLNTNKIESLTALQTAMSVKERLDETEELLGEINLDKKEQAIDLFAFAEERFYSAELWTKFFRLEDKSNKIDETNLKNSCENKISETEERLQYLREYIPVPLTKSEQEISKAYLTLEKDPITCLYLASKAKAEINSILGLMGVKQERVKDILNTKLDLVKKSLARAQQKGIFPLISYSYYEYANSLKSFDENNAILYAEYALEFASLDIYFPLNKLNEEKPSIILKKFSLTSFIAGMSFAFFIISIILFRKSQKKKIRILKKNKLR
ncbi:hypothetical protein HY837_04550 [archaeon]|nr:hypothetical protein [archaeon]